MKVKDANKDIKKMKLKVQETKHKTKEWKGNYQNIIKEVALSCKNFAGEGIIEEMALDAKVAQLVDIVVGLRKKVTNLEE